MSDKRHPISDELREEMRQAGETAQDRYHQKMIEKWGGQDAARHMGDLTHHVFKGRTLTAKEHAYYEGAREVAERHQVKDWEHHIEL